MKKETIIKVSVIVFMSLLVLSGITAFPIKSELAFLMDIKSIFPSNMQHWVTRLNENLQNTPSEMFYGTDWLAFAHLIIALYFFPLINNPIKYQINLKIGMIACLAVLPLAFICGPIRDIPFFHQLIDCSFGLIGFAFLAFINHNIKQLKHEKE